MREILLINKRLIMNKFIAIEDCLYYSIPDDYYYYIMVVESLFDNFLEVLVDEYDLRVDDEKT